MWKTPWSRARSCITVARGSRAAATRRSRARLVACSDAARAELGKALHDGAQQRVVAVSLLLRSLRGGLEDAESLALVDRALEELAVTGEELRDLRAGSTRWRSPTMASSRPCSRPRRGRPCRWSSTSPRSVSPARSSGPPTTSCWARSSARASACVALARVARTRQRRRDPRRHRLQRARGRAALCAADRVETIRGTLELNGSRLRARFPLERAK